MVVRLAAATAILTCASLPIFASGQGDHRQPMPQRNAPPPSAQMHPNNNPQFRGGRNHDQHFSQWMDSHSHLTPEQQQRALQQEPGFRSLPHDQQLKLQDRLQKLNQMPPAERERMLQRNEAIEKMSPAQRRNFQSAMQRWTTMDPDRKRAVAKSFRDLRSLPPNQRAAALNSQEYRSRLTDEERGTLSTILEAEPVPGQPVVPPQH